MAKFLWTPGIRESTWQPSHRARRIQQKGNMPGKEEKRSSQQNIFLWHTSCLLWHHQREITTRPRTPKAEALKCPNPTSLFIKAHSQLWAASASGAGKHWGKEAWDGLTLEWKLIHQVSFLTLLPKAGQSFIQVKWSKGQFPSNSSFPNFWSAPIESQIPSFQFLFTPQPAPSLGSMTNISVIPEGAPGLSHCRPTWVYTDNGEGFIVTGFCSNSILLHLSLLHCVCSKAQTRSYDPVTGLPPSCRN